MMDSLEQSEQRQVMASLAERYKMKLVPQAASNGGSFRPYPKRKTKPF
jgi:hypothetical protein